MPWRNVWSTFCLSPMRTRMPIPSGSDSPNTTRHSVATTSPPATRPSPSRRGHHPRSWIATHTATMVRPETVRTRSAVVSVRWTRSDSRGDDASAMALMTTAPMPRSANGRRLRSPLSRPYWA
ncbi:Uncharacterised protein [Mycobacteroides abscessus]|nr:Uncharacterised protein [Mycobacteroides abscessus]